MRGAGVGVTAGGTVLPMGDLIRMAGHAYHYLTVFEKAPPGVRCGWDGASASPPPTSGLSCTNWTGAAPSPDAPCPATDARSITPTRAGPMAG